MDELRELMDFLKETSETFAAEMQPYGDWDPMLFVVHEKELALVGFEMPPNGDQREEMFMTVLPNLVHSKLPNPDAVVMLVSAWYVQKEDLKGEGWKEGDILPSEHPDRKECLLLQGISKDNEISYMARINRSESSPELEWLDEMDGAQFGGRLVACLRRALWT